jgi:alpha-L-rhamnosidase
MRTRALLLHLLSLAALAGLLPALVPYDLRIDGLVDPLGVDSDRTFLSWKLRSGPRGDHQTAWQVLVATSAEKLEKDVGDIWDTGRREGNDQIAVRYRGAAMESARQAFWKVRVWNAEGEAGPWSTPATWTMGLVRQADWTADWIAHPAWLEQDRPHLGYRSLPAERVDTPKWIQLDLGAVHEITEVRLHGLRHTVAERLGMPQEYLLEVALKEDFSDAVPIADTRGDPVNPWRARHTHEAAGVEGRFLRLTVPVLRELNGEICLALSQIEVRAGDRNVAPGAKVTASDSLEEGPWSAAALVDGKGLPGAFPIATETVLMRREFEVGDGLKRALVFATGLGQYVLELNGERVGDVAISPGWTDAAETVLYDTFDVTARVRAGDSNALGLELAGGMYNVPEPDGRYTKFVGRFRPLKARLQLRLEYTDGSVQWVETDEAWSARAGPTVYSHVFGGEVHDARRDPGAWSEPGYDEAEWVAVAVAPAPGGWMRGTSHAAPPVRPVETLSPVAVNDLRDGVTVYDLGQNASLMVRLEAAGPRGSMVRIVPAELLHPDGSVDPGSTGRGFDSWDYILAGEGGGEHWQSRFFYHGARYLQVECLPPAEGGPRPEVRRIEGLVTHADAPPAGTFACSSELWTRTREIIRWAQRSNLMSVLTDCPHRERLGWLEQYHLNGPALRYEFDLRALYRKTFQDMVDAQTEAGLIPNIAPEFIVFGEGFRDSPEWGAAIILAAWQQYVFTRDETPLFFAYNAMQAYIEYLAGRATGHILDHGLGDWYDLGPNPPGYGQLTPRALTATATYFEACRTLGEIAAMRGRQGEATAYRERAERIREAFNARFFDRANGHYASNSQTANAMPLALGMVPEGREVEVLAALVAAIEREDDAVTAGDVGHRYVLRALAEGGRSDLVFRMHHRTDRPGYGWQVERGKTSLTEAWDGGSSQNHFMLGHINEWFYRDLVGIAPDPAAPGFEHFYLRPQPVGDLTWAEASYEAAVGPIRVRWEREGGTFHFLASVPPNARATVVLPADANARLSEGGRPLDGLPGIRSVRREDATAILEIGSGDYAFTVHSFPR